MKFKFDLQRFAGLDKKVAAFGLAGLEVCRILTDSDGSAPTYETTWHKLPIQEITIGKSVNKIKERGDERILNVEPLVDAYTLTWVNAQVPFDALAMINGSKYVANAAGNTILLEKGEDVPAMFAVRAVTKKTYEGKGPMGIYIPKVSGTLTVSPKAGDFVNCSFDGEFVPRESDDLAIGYILLNAGQGIEDVTEVNLKPAP